MRLVFPNSQCTNFLTGSFLCYSCCPICQTLCVRETPTGTGPSAAQAWLSCTPQYTTPSHLTLAFNVCIRSFIHKSIVFCMILTGGRELVNVKPCTADTCLETRTRSYSSTDDGINYSLLTCTTCFSFSYFCQLISFPPDLDTL